jgi:hypothetical protein
MLLLCIMAIPQLNFPDADGTDLSSLLQEFRQNFVMSAGFLKEELCGRQFLLNRDGREMYPFETDDDSWNGEVQRLKPSAETTQLASVDSSCILMGETSTGALYAVRAGIGFSSGGALRSFCRLGPFMVYLSEKASYGLVDELSNYELRICLTDHSIAERVIRNSIERRIVSSLLRTPNQRLVMADGSLKHPAGIMRDGLAHFDYSQATLVGFSKSSSLIFASGPSSAISKTSAASFAIIEEGLIKTALAKFKADGLVFRIDVINSSVPLASTLGKILSNDTFSAGYPESLRVAHHLSVFSRAENAALKACLRRSYSLHYLPSFDLRRIALGSFRGGRR